MANYDLTRIKDSNSNAYVFGVESISKVNGLQTALDAKATPTDISNAIATEVTNRNTAITNAVNALDVSDSAVANKFVTAVSETNGKIYVSRATLTATNVAQAGTLSNSTTGNASSASQLSARAIIDGGNTNTYKFHRIAYANWISSSYNDNEFVAMIRHRFNGGGVGIVKCGFRTENQSSTAAGSVSAQWISKANTGNLGNVWIAIKLDATNHRCLCDVFYESPCAYPRANVYSLVNNGFTFVNSSEASSAASHTECWDSIVNAGVALHGDGFTYTNYYSASGCVADFWATARNFAVADSTSAHTGATSSVNGSANVTLKLPSTITASVVGNVTGNCSGSSSSCTGNSASATSAGKWTTARNIWIADSDSTNTGVAVSVDGSANATLKLPSTIKASITGDCSGSAGSVAWSGVTSKPASFLNVSRGIAGCSSDFVDITTSVLNTNDVVYLFDSNDSAGNMASKIEINVVNLEGSRDHTLVCVNSTTLRFRNTSASVDYWLKRNDNGATKVAKNNNYVDVSLEPGMVFHISKYGTTIFCHSNAEWAQNAYQVAAHPDGLENKDYNIGFVNADSQSSTQWSCWLRYDTDSLKYNPSTNTLKVTNVEGTATKAIQDSLAHNIHTYYGHTIDITNTKTLQLKNAAGGVINAIDLPYVPVVFDQLGSAEGVLYCL